MATIYHKLNYYHEEIFLVPGAVENVEVTVLSDDIFHVTWDPPLSPNGVLTGYHIVVTDLINSSEIFTNVILPSVQELNITSGICMFKCTTHDCASVSSTSFSCP